MKVLISVLCLSCAVLSNAQGQKRVSPISKVTIDAAVQCDTGSQWTLQLTKTDRICTMAAHIIRKDGKRINLLLDCNLKRTTCRGLLGEYPFNEIPGQKERKEALVAAISKGLTAPLNDKYPDCMSAWADACIRIHVRPSVTGGDTVIYAVTHDLK